MKKATAEIAENAENSLTLCTPTVAANVAVQKKKALRSLRALRLLSVIGFFVCVLCGQPAFAQQTHLLVITGVPGDDEHAKQFAKWAAAFVDAAKTKDAVADANITVLADRAATKEGVEKAFADLAARVKPTDAVVVLLIGHGK